MKEKNLELIDFEVEIVLSKSFSKLSLDELFILCKSRYEIISNCAVRCIHTKGGAAAFEFAKKLSFSIKYRERCLACFILGQLDTPNGHFSEESFKILEKMIDDIRVSVQERALVAIGSLSNFAPGGQPITLAPKIIQSAKANSAHVRSASAFALAFTRDKSAHKALEELSNDCDAEVRSFAELAMDIRKDLELR